MQNHEIFKEEVSRWVREFPEGWDTKISLELLFELARRGEVRIRESYDLDFGDEWLFWKLLNTYRAGIRRHSTAI